jgi:ankyrin repeat protein
MPERRRSNLGIVAVILSLIGIADLLMVAKEHSMEQQTSPFAGTDILSLSQAIAEGDIWQISQQENPTRLSLRGDLQLTLLQWAILLQQPDSVEALLRVGADIGQPGLEGNSALHMAAMVSDPQYLRLLLQYSPPVNVRNANTGATPLAAAVLAGREEQLRMLLNAGADSTLSDRTGDTPVHLAAKINAPALALLLLQTGADAKAHNQQGRTFQHYFSQTPEHLQNSELREQFRQLNAWLEARKLAGFYGKR